MKQYLLGAASLLVVAAAAIGGHSYYQEQQVDPMIQENLEALTQNEGQDYNNAKLAYCSSTSDRMGCKSALFRRCDGSAFCR